MNITSINNLSEIHHNFISDTFALHAAKKGLVNDYRSFAFEVREGNELIGVICGNTLFDEVHIADLVVADGYRGQGVGRKLLQQVERYFADKGFTHITLTTLGYQAPGFYEKCGFEAEFVRKHHSDPRMDKYHFIKKL